MSCYILIVLYTIVIATSLLAVHSMGLEHQVRLAAGVYANESTISPEYKNIVLVTACNFGYLNHFHNFKCFVDRLDLKVVAFALDFKTFSYFKSKSNVTTWNNVYPALYDVGAPEGSSEFRKGSFQKLSVAKFLVVHEVIKLGYNVLFSDPDVAIVRDPLPQINYTKFDYIHSVNAKCQFTNSWSFRELKSEGNTGFHFVRSNQNMLKLWAMFLSYASKADSKFDDQTLFWNFLKRMERNNRNSVKGISIAPQQSCRTPLAKKLPNKIYTCPLDFCSFASGILGSAVGYELASKKIKQQGKVLYTAHANFIVGNSKKQVQLDSNGYWLATQLPDETWGGECRNFTPSV